MSTMATWSVGYLDIDKKKRNVEFGLSKIMLLEQNVDKVSK
jgi:hypothetical protein